MPLSAKCNGQIRVTARKQIIQKLCELVDYFNTCYATWLSSNKNIDKKNISDSINLKLISF